MISTLADKDPQAIPVQVRSGVAACITAKLALIEATDVEDGNYAPLSYRQGPKTKTSAKGYPPEELIEQVPDGFGRVVLLDVQALRDLAYAAQDSGCDQVALEIHAPGEAIPVAAMTAAGEQKVFGLLGATPEEANGMEPISDRVYQMLQTMTAKTEEAQSE